MSRSRVCSLFRIAAVLATLLVATDTADAFYWKNWPGSGTQPTTSQPTSTTTSTGGASVSTTSTGTGSTSDPIVTTTGDPTGSTTGSQVPEPSTLLAWLIGIVALGIVATLSRLRRRATPQAAG